jgi:hypothetical protein
MSKEVDDAIRSSFLAFAIKAFAQLYPGKELENCVAVRNPGRDAGHQCASKLTRLV